MPPTVLINSLESVRRRAKVLGVAYGVGIVLAAIIGLLLATILIDYVLNLYAAPRLLIILTALAAIVYAATRWVVKPMSAKLSLSDVAGRLEQTFPEFNDRLRSTIDFVRADMPGSEMMKQRVVGEAAELAGRLDLGRAVVATPAYYSLSMGLGAIVLAVILAVSSPKYASIAMSRLFNPFNAQAWPKRVEIQLTGNMPQRVPVGQHIDVRMKLARGDSSSRQASIFYQYDDGPVQREIMVRGEDGTYGASLDARVDSGKAASSLHIWMQAGDDEKHLSAITVVPRLSIKSVQADLTPPPYVTSQKMTTVDLSAAPAMVADGSRITLHIGFNKPLANGANVEIVPASPEMTKPDVKWQADNSADVSGTWTARQSLRFHIKATDTDGFNNNALEEYELIVKPDQSPSVQIENPRRNEDRTAVSVVPLVGLAEDDYGIAWLKLVAQREGDKKQWQMDLLKDGVAQSGATVSPAEGSADRLRYRVNYQWDLSQLKDANLKPGDVLEYYLLVKDNFNLDGQTHAEVPSGKLRITIITQDDLTAKVVDELRLAKAQITSVRAANDRTKQETSGLATDTKDKPQLDAADRTALERLTNQQATAAAQTKQIAAKVSDLKDRLAENKSPAQDIADIARDVANQLDQAAENPMKQATNQLSDANQPNQKNDQRNQDLNNAANNQQQANEQLDQALSRMNNIGSLQETIAKLKDILAEQQRISKETRDLAKDNLGKTPDQMKPEDRDKLNKNADDQNKLADRTNKAMDEMQKTADQMAKSDPSSADAMKQAAQSGQQQQVAPNQQKAAQASKQNQQAQAQAAQNQAELGLQVMLNQLNEAEKHKLAELQKQLEELQNQIANLIRRQAGHNLDNLSLQGPGRLAKIESTVLSDLLDKAERSKDNLPPVPSISQLSDAQEQTERNTRDIGKTAEAIPNGAEPASHLTRAAAKMERAIVNLRDKKLPDAYDPPQVDALAELDQAKKVVDEQKKQVDQQLEDQQKENIRQKFVKIRDDQQKLNDETVRIDKARNPDDKSLSRADAVRLGQMPGEQGRLTDRTKEISDDLSALNSTIYLWAVKDIVQTMTDVKDDLGKQATDMAVQAQQQRVVDQLDAMIRNLATKPRDSKFAQDAGGQGGGQQGGGGPKLPTEAELRLLQDLQKAVNKTTKVLDSDAVKDKSKLLALGNRQGDFRSLLDQMLQQASQGQIKLGPEPDNRDQLPEEAKKEDVENQELEQNLLNDVPNNDQKGGNEANLIGDRMARSHQRLALNDDPGKVTQMIQDRIIIDLDALIDQARQQQMQTRNSPQKGQQKGQQMGQAQANQGQPQNQGQGKQQQQPGAKPAGQSTPPGAQAVNTDISKEIKDSAAEWGAITPRLRDAVLQGADENTVEQYRKLVEEYFRSVGDKTAGQQQ